jgi:hypothetical protein
MPICDIRIAKSASIETQVRVAARVNQQTRRVGVIDDPHVAPSLPKLLPPEASECQPPLRLHLLPVLTQVSDGTVDVRLML